MRRCFLSLFMVLVVTTSCSMFVPSTIKEAQATNSAILTTVVQRQRDGNPMDNVKLYTSLTYIAGTEKVIAKWEQGEEVDIKALKEKVDTMGKELMLDAGK